MHENKHTLLPLLSPFSHCEKHCLALPTHLLHFDIAAQRLEAGQRKFKNAGLAWMLRGPHEILLRAMFVTPGLVQVDKRDFQIIYLFWQNCKEMCSHVSHMFVFWALKG